MAILSFDKHAVFLYILNTSIINQLIPICLIL